MPKEKPTSPTAAELLARYDKACFKAAHEIINFYSTSFSMATRLLRGQVKEDVRNLYAMVRIADEIVDGTAEGAGLSPTEVEKRLDDYEAAVLAAPAQRFHVDPVLHAWGYSARRCGFKEEHVRAFFASMRRDVDQTTYDQESFEDYVYGSAEVIGLMCLDAFLVSHPVSEEEYATLTHGARSLGAAFQKVNFLRDLAEDSGLLGRTYFPELREGGLTESTKDALIADIRVDLDAAYACVPLLPTDARLGVQAAADLFAELTDRIDARAASDVATRRVSVPPARKSYIIARAVKRAAFSPHNTSDSSGARS